MVEVFKTNVENRHHADMLVNRVHETFPGYKANFDLDDCDKILRVEYAAGLIQSDSLIVLLRHAGFTAEILPGDCQIH